MYTSFFFGELNILWKICKNLERHSVKSCWIQTIRKTWKCFHLNSISLQKLIQVWPSSSIIPKYDPVILPTSFHFIGWLFLVISCIINSSAIEHSQWLQINSTSKKLYNYRVGAVRFRIIALKYLRALANLS